MYPTHSLPIDFAVLSVIEGFGRKVLPVHEFFNYIQVNALLQIRTNENGSTSTYGLGSGVPGDPGEGFVTPLKFHDRPVIIRCQSECEAFAAPVVNLTEYLSWYHEQFLHGSTLLWHLNQLGTFKLQHCGCFI